jgi:electron transfer flavoprotein alpha subunit
VEGVRQAEGRLVLTRAAIFGKALEDIAPLGLPLAITVQPGAFPVAQAGETPSPPVRVVTMEHPACRSRLLESPPGPVHDQALSQAQVVVAARRGIGKPENLELLRRLAACFSGATLAGSRPVCDMGWLGYQSQVGLTGATVAPKLYLACGISGARQHTMGMAGAGFIVAINTDPQAAIFNLADVAVIEDLTRFIPAFLDCCHMGDS